MTLMCSSCETVGAYLFILYITICIIYIFSINSLCINGGISFLYHRSQSEIHCSTLQLSSQINTAVYLNGLLLAVRVTMGTGKPIRKTIKGYNLIGSSCLSVLLYNFPCHHSRSAGKLWVLVCVRSQGAAITCYRDGVGHRHVLPPTAGQSHKILSKTAGTVNDCAALHAVVQNSWGNNER